MNCNTAVFYDVENLISLFHAKGNKTLRLDEIHRRILALEMVQGISVQRAYADWVLQTNRNLRSYVLQIGIEPVQIFNTNQNDKVKNAADVSLIIDAVELLSKHPEVENYVIASGDGIFAFLAKKLHEYGKRVIGCGFDRNSNIIFKNACDIYIPLEKTDSSLIAVVKNFIKGTIATAQELEQAAQLAVPAPAIPAVTAATALNAAIVPPATPAAPATPSATATPAAPATPTATATPAAPAAPVPDPAADAKTASKLPKNKFSEILINADIPVWLNSRDQSTSLHIIKKMVNTIFDHPEADSGLEISLFKAYVDHYLPTFRMSTYGFKRFGEFMRFLVTGSRYCLMVYDGTIVKVMTRGSQADNDDIETVDDIPNLVFTLKSGGTAKSLFDIEDGMSFSFSFSPDPKPVPVIQQEEPAKPQIYQPPVTEAKLVKSDTVRKWIKREFLWLSQENKIPAKELKKLITEDYSKKTFGVKIPIFKEIKTRDNLNEQRVANGKVKYWRDEFKFNGKSYLVFKEWIDKQHRAKFEVWLDSLK